MSVRKISILALAGLMTMGVVGSFAEDAFVAPTDPTELVAARKALMKEDGALLKAAGGLTGAEAVTAMQTLLTNYSHIPALFPEGSVVGDSEALPAIWQNWDAFVAIVETGKTAAQAGLTAAEAGDAAAYNDAIKAIGGTCGQCHQQFRS